MVKYYAGIGSRKTPEHIQRLMTEIAEILERRKFKLRTGYAIGSDQAFCRGVSSSRNKEIYNTDDCIINGDIVSYSKEDLKFAERMVKEYHPIPKVLSGDNRKLIARNTFQIFGIGEVNVNSEFVICFTDDGAETNKTTAETGGTGQAIRIAYDYGIPVYNLKNYIGVKAQEMVDFILKETSESRK